MTENNSSTGHPFRIIEVRNNLKNKASRQEGISPKEAIEKAEARVADLAEEYDTRLKDDIEQLRELSSQISTQPVETWQKPLLRLVHDMEGQAGVFGFEIISFVSGSAGRVLEHAPPDHPKYLATIEAHCDAIFLVYNQKIRGDGGSAGRALVRGLKATADTCVPPAHDRRAQLRQQQEREAAAGGNDSGRR
ncbi:MAG TPA: hypothetical protein DFI00_06800 [Rhodospirillaceae bacterium]|nr:hypothetical protein [Alphaproteobacteria bacterium]OUT41283.1 MAG: hypothetical protein CBB62_02710 [Micavibrio sp. TMED2]HCI46983.1 hypothetical protein [Rhodospirillaceae bacterium]MAS47192.1 hypothetical protein [Alphaproteobacteria bacterium]MAX95286.1 hypothetical protein [Alphaproteobacteria bacterium]|tara:strand:+ start:5862 stop:6437 length:576 start_codon:yes stop_codon:yes gene_type:complete